MLIKQINADYEYLKTSDGGIFLIKRVVKTKHYYSESVLLKYL